MAKWKGRARVRRLLRQIPDDIRNEIADVFERYKGVILANSKANTPTRTGFGRNLLDAWVARKALRMRIGLRGRLKNDNSKASRGFYLNILDRGRRPQTVKANRSKPSGGVSTYMMRIRAIPDAKYDIVFGRARAFAVNILNAPLKDSFERVLRKLSGGGYGD